MPLGDYMYRVYASTKDLRGERVIYRLIGADPKSEQTWGAYARSVLAFSAVSVLFLFLLQLVQGKLPLHLNDPATPMTPALAWNTAVSFVTNTNWQAYSGESTQGHLVQMAGLAVQNFVSAAVGMAVAMAFVRGLARRNTGELGNFWVDLVRGSIRILLPLSVIAAIILVVGGTIQNFGTARPGGQHAGGRAADHHRRPGRQPGVHQAARHQRRRVLQRQLRASLREPHRMDQLGRDLPVGLHRILAAPNLRPHGREQEAGLCHRGGDVGDRIDQRHVDDVVPNPAPRNRSHRGGIVHGRCGTALRRAEFSGLRRSDDADVDGCGGLVPRLLHQPRRHDHAVQHAARRGGARRRRVRPVRHAHPGHHHGVRGGPDGRPYTGVPRQEDHPAGNQARRNVFPDHSADRADRYRRRDGHAGPTGEHAQHRAARAFGGACTRSPPRPTTTVRHSQASA